MYKNNTCDYCAHVTNHLFCHYHTDVILSMILHSTYVYGYKRSDTQFYQFFLNKHTLFQVVITAIAKINFNRYINVTIFNIFLYTYEHLSRSGVNYILLNIDAHCFRINVHYDVLQRIISSTSSQLKFLLCFLLSNKSIITVS